MVPISRTLLESLPGWEIVSEGLADVSHGRVTPAACTIWIALPRLSRAGLVDQTLLRNEIRDPEGVLYDLLCQDEGNAFGRYNALLRRLAKFERALDRVGHDSLGALGPMPSGAQGPQSR